MTDIKQTQKAGDSSNQAQFNGCTFNINAVSDQIIQQAIQQYTTVAADLALSRMKDFSANYLIPRIQKIESGLEAFRDPAWQMLLISANKRAATTTSNDSYAVLAELMAKRFEERTNIKSNAVVEKAVEIIGLIDDDSLLVLSLLTFIQTGIIPTTGDIHKGLQLMNDIVNSILNTQPFPKDTNWVDNLEVLGAIRRQIGVIVGPTKFIEKYFDALNGYTITGIEKNSPEYLKATNLLQSNGISTTTLVEHILNPGFMRLNIVTKTTINESNFSDTQKDTLYHVFDMSHKQYSGIDMKKNLNDYISNNFPVLNLFKEWTDSIPPVLLTPIGRLLGYMNARRLVPELPMLK